ncbi:hypothetical protein SE17_23350 [Kouleothrix aurantiaca]|uniref:YtkA-like domain-containing protein n=1 Tax=Kouleothrix aurantiaca TaxID=186479 RepID=A0A0P9D747_9CHLR|nr:hypothetical protein SE17_23350 [Kouleothrix aurantiaca]
MTRLKIVLIGCLLATLALAACAGNRPGYATDTQVVDGLTFALERPSSITPLQDYELTLTLSDGAGKPLDGAIVFLEQDMPGMPMGSTQPLGEPLGSGKYRIKGVFTMDGKWILKIHATVAGQDHVASFEQVVSPQQ